MAIDWSDGHLCRDGVNFESSRQKLTVYAPLFVAASPIWRTSPYSSHLTADGRSNLLTATRHPGRLAAALRKSRSFLRLAMSSKLKGP